jgi:acyl-CoA dehydrogenase
MGDVEVARALARDPARDYERQDMRLGPACAKLFASEVVGRLADRAAQIHRGAGYIRGVHVEHI